MTLSCIFSTTLTPASSIQVNSSSPGPGTFMKNDRKGLADMPGCSSAANTGSPANVTLNELMMLRGMGLPSASLRCPVSITCEISVLISMTSPILVLSGSLMRAFAMGSLPLRLAAAPANCHLDVALAHQEAAIAELGNHEHVLGSRQPHAAGHHGPAGEGREMECRHPRLWVGRGDDVNRADVVGLRHGTVDRDREGHGIAVLGDLGQIDEHLALDRLGIPEQLFYRLLPALACILCKERRRQADHGHAGRGTQGKLAAIGLAGRHR